MSATNLPVLKAEHRPFITDIFIPFKMEDHSASSTSTADPDDAICYIGQAQPYRLFDNATREQFAWFTKLWSQAAKTVETGEDFRIAHEHGFFRAHRMHTAGGFKLALRSIPKRTPLIEELPKPQIWQDLLMDPELLYGGLVMLTGTNGMGKTTLAASTVTSRLAYFGGHANTAEDPIEYPMEGLHTGAKTGVCFQHSVSAREVEPGKSVYAQSLSKALRAYPAITGGGTILLVGEVRDPETAAELLLAASNGHLVITTFHGHNITSAMARFLSMAQQTLHASARDLFAASLRVATHQVLRFDANAVPDTNEPWKRGKFDGTIIWNHREGNSSTQKSLREANLIDAVNGIAAFQQKIIKAGEGKVSLADFKKQALTMPEIKSTTALQ